MGEADRMGIDLIAGGRVKTGHRKDASFNKVVLQRLFQSNTNRPPVTISFIARQMKEKEDKTAVFVGTVTNDIRMLDVPKLTICCLRITEAARARVIKAGGEGIPFDQLALRAPTGTGCVLLRGKRTARVANRYFGKVAEGARPRVRSKGRKFEKARGRRRSRGFKC